MQKHKRHLVRKQALAGIGDRAQAHSSDGLPAKVGVLNLGLLIGCVLATFLDGIDGFKGEVNHSKEEFTACGLILTQRSVKVVWTCDFRLPNTSA